MKTEPTALEKVFGKPASEITNEELKEFLRQSTDYCGCGCGTIIENPDSQGRYRKYVKGHNSRVNHSQWKGGRITDTQGYIQVRIKDHLRAVNGYVYEHIVVMEKYLKRDIGIDEVVHHIDEDRTNNYIGNLMLFKKRGGHATYHRKLRAFKACGHWEWEVCHYCSKYGDPSTMRPLVCKDRKGKDRVRYFHRTCRRKTSE